MGSDDNGTCGHYSLLAIYFPPFKHRRTASPMFERRGSRSAPAKYTQAEPGEPKIPNGSETPKEYRARAL